VSGIAKNLPDWLNVSRETEEKLLALSEIVIKWTPAVNLIAKSTIPEIWHRHILDSAQLFSFAPAHARRWLDLGSGAGFPGLVIAVLAKEHRPDLHVVLIEADQRKSVFLSEAARAIDVSVSICNIRVETASPQAADVVSARALTSLHGLCAFANNHLNRNGIAVFPKGLNANAEIVAARRDWQFALDVHTSKTDPAAAILLLRNIKNV